MTVSGDGGNSKPNHTRKLTSLISDLLIRFRKTLRILSASVVAANAALKICSIVHFVFVVNGEWPYFLGNWEKLTIPGCVHGATGRHMWEVHLDRVLSQAQSLVSDECTLLVKWSH